MKKSTHDAKTSEFRPVSKATMDAPQEEFIEDQAGVVANDPSEHGRGKEAPSGDKTETAESTDF